MRPSYGYVEGKCSRPFHDEALREGLTKTPSRSLRSNEMGLSFLGGKWSSIGNVSNWNVPNFLAAVQIQHFNFSRFLDQSMIREESIRTLLVYELAVDDSNRNNSQVTLEFANLSLALAVVHS